MGRAPPTHTLRKDKMQVLIQALQSMANTTVLQHPRVALSSIQSPPKIFRLAHKRKKKFLQVAELAAQHEAIVHTYQPQGWHIIHQDTSSKKHPDIGHTVHT